MAWKRVRFAIMGAVVLATASPVVAGAAGRDPARVFVALDKDGDGFVSKAELLAAPRLSAARSADDVRARREALFARLDRNGDGRLSREELAALHDPAPDKGR